MMKNEIYILAVVVLVLAGCYDDKGNYDYKNVNDLTITFEPEVAEILGDCTFGYTYKQPPKDTLKVIYTANVAQSMETNEDNLAYIWEVSYNKPKGGGQPGVVKVTDSIFANEIELVYPPKQSSRYEVKFKVSDKSTNIDYYAEFTMKTMVPFLSSWYVLNGAKGDRRLSVIEDPDDSDMASITLDAYEALWERRRFQNAEHIIYSGVQNSDNTRWESLTVIQPDTVNWLFASDLTANKPFELLFPLNSRLNFAWGVGNEPTYLSVVVDNTGKFHHAGLSGYYFPAIPQVGLEDYIIDKLYMSEAGFITAFDAVHQKFMFYNMMENGCYWTYTPTYPEKEEGNRALLKTVPLDALPDENDVKHYDILWIGRGILKESKERGALAIGKNRDSVEYVLYHVGQDQGKDDKKRDTGGGELFIKKVSLGKLNMNENSSFATSNAYDDQFFYTVESKLYLYNTVNKQSTELYEAGQVISDIQFRTESSHYMVTNENRCLAVVVNNPNGTGELHEVFLDEAGDVMKVNVHTGFGTIQDVVYTYLTRKIY